MFEFAVSERWSRAYPGAAVGILLLRNAKNPERHGELERAKNGLEADLRSRFQGADRAALRAGEPLRAYDAYYRKFDKTYHVQLQLESLVHKGKPIPTVAALVEAMFMAELKNQLLTAGHDADALRMPVRINVSDGTESYLRLDGREQVLKAGDMFIADAEGVLSSVLYGPDSRTRIRSETRNALFTVYAPPGIDADPVRSHLEDIAAYVSLFSPVVEVVRLEVLRTA